MVLGTGWPKYLAPISMTVHELISDHNEILHMPRQSHCRDMCKVSLWSVEYILNQSTANFGRISNSIEISLVGRAPGHNLHRSWQLNCHDMYEIVTCLQH